MWSSDASVATAQARSSSLPWRLAATVLTLALTSCWSQVGNLPNPTPTAVAATVGQPYTIDSSGVLHTTVRAGADVVLTGVNSQTATNDSGIPIITWKWSQVNPVGTPVDLIKRTNDTSSFTAPQVSQATTLTFQLTVTNANAASASAQAQVVVEPAPDADHFLTFVNVNDRITVAALTSAVVGKASGAAYNATLAFTVTVTKLVTYTDSSGTQHTRVPVGRAMTYSGGWAAGLGSGGTSCSDPRNPQFQIPIPSLNLDDPLADGSGKRLSDVMQLSDIDLDPANAQIPPAIVYAQVQIASTALPSGVTPGVCVGGTSSFSNTAATNTLISDSATLTAAANTNGGLFDTSSSAHAYYAAIAGDAKSTLATWLTANGFDTSLPNWGADAHAVYTNNFDLGLGRDMYLKANCPAGTPALSQMTSQQLYAAIGHCDVASVVVNYVGLQAAAENLNSIVAVAMEYSATSSSGGARFTKFYAFAPDTRTGQLQRVTSVDLDHRGQKYLPQACIVCHGGTPGTVTGSGSSQQYSNGGNVSSGFLPWDLVSLLYSDTDPGFSQKSQDAALKAQYTEANQVGALKLLNAGAYLTADDPNRFALLRELLEGWYGGHGLPGSFNGDFVPAGWQVSTNGNASGSDTLYKDVFSKTCRACHVMQLPASPGGQFNNLANGGAQGSGTASCASTVNPSTLGAGDQFPMGCYWQFAKSQNLLTYLTDARMPFARRTMDRLWVDSSGYPSATGKELITNLSQASVNIVPAGTTTLVANPSFVTLDTSSAAGFGFTAGGVKGDVSNWITLIPTDPVLGELFAKPSWQVCNDPGTGAPASESCTGSSSQFAVVGSTAIPAQFQIPQSGNFLLELASSGTKVTTAQLSVPKLPPTVQNLPATILPLQPLVIDLSAAGLVSAGNGPVSSYTWWVTNLTNLSVAPQGANSCQSQAQGCSLTYPVTLSLSPTSALSASYTVNVADLNVPAGVGSSTASVAVTHLPANPQTGFVCSYDYMFAGTNGTQAVLGGAGTCPTSTSTTGPLDLSQGYVPPPPPPTLTLQAQLQCAPSASATSTCSNTQWVPGTLTLSGTQLQYTPPTGFATNSKDGTVANSNTVALNYQLVLLDSHNNQVANTGWVPLTVQVRANVSFDNDVVAGVFQSSNVPQKGQGTCTSCHVAATSPGSPPPDGLDFTQSSAGIYTALCGSGPTCNASSSYSGPNPPISGQFVITNSVLSGVLIAHPADLTNYNPPFGHGGGNRCPSNFTTGTPAAPVTPSTCDLTNVLLWIEDGANNF